MSQKNKNILLILGFIIIVFLAYRYAISNTLRLKGEFKTLRQEALVFENLPLKLSSLKKKEIYYDSILIKYKLDEGSVQNSLLNTINHFADQNKLKVVDFVEPHTMNKGDLTVNTYQFTLEGGYNNIISLIYEMEQNTKFGEIINLDFRKNRNYKTGNFYLQATVLLRSFG